MKIRHLLIVFMLGLGLTLAMLWALRLGPVLAATFSVTQFTDDSGACNANCSLREAILAANAAPGPDTVSLPAGTHSLSITGAGEDNSASGDLDITEALTITGAGPDATVIEASGLADRIFHVLTGTVTISGVTIRNGSGAERGGGIMNQATLRLIHSSVISNSARGRDDDFGTDAYGGGIWNSGTLVLTQSQVISNSAHGGNGLVGGEGSTAGGGYGGGIWNSGSLTLTNSFVISNSARSGSSPSGGSDALGGGLENFGGTIALFSSTVSGNEAHGSYGGGGGIDSFEGEMTLADSLVSDNLAYDEGGGILNDSWGSENRAVVISSTISGNSAGSYGGGITNYGTLAIRDSTISSNHADFGYGGGLYSFKSEVTVVNSTISDNAANSLGGGIYSGADTMVLSNSTVASNTATNAGGIYNSYGVQLQNSIVANNHSNNCYKVATSLGHNLDSGNTCGLAATGDLTDTNPLLGPLQNNGGKTKTRALLPGSPAINAAENSACPATDQRGVARPQGGVCDIGSYELEFASRIYLPAILKKGN